MRRTQIPLFTPETEWVMPDELKDLRGYKEIAIDLETNDPDLKELGSGNVTGKGHIAGVAVAVEGWSGYYPIQHEQMAIWTKNWYFRGCKTFLIKKILHLYFTMQCMISVG